VKRTWQRKILTIVCGVLALTGVSALVAAPAQAQQGTGCFVRSSFGYTNRYPQPAEGNGPVILDAEGLYDDPPYNTQIVDIAWATYTGPRVGDLSQFYGKLTAGTITINGVVKKEDQLAYPGKQTSPSYSVHGMIYPTWIDSAGSPHILVKGDLITWKLEVTYQASDPAKEVTGQTIVSCRV
jgi:hypothetical protein